VAVRSFTSWERARGSRQSYHALSAKYRFHHWIISLIQKPKHMGAMPRSQRGVVMLTRLLFSNVPVDCSDDFLKKWIEDRGYLVFERETYSRCRQSNVTEFRACAVNGFCETR
jgi:hypothetical protein